MTYQNAQRKNSGNDEGDILKFFQSKLRNLIAYNGGDHSFSSYTEDVDDKNAPMRIWDKNQNQMNSLRAYYLSDGKKFV